MNIVFMGTPEIAVSCLKSLEEAGHNILCAFTQPDRPKDRGHKLQMPPVKEYALSRGIEVYQPQSMKRGEDADSALEILMTLQPDCIVVVAYGQILPTTIINIPQYGCINVHASMLPKYRGAAPIQRAIIDGCTETGVTIMYIGEGIDTGDIILAEPVRIPHDMTGSVLYDELSKVGARLIVEALEKLENGTATRTEQGDGASRAAMITKELCHIDFTKPSNEVYNLIRGLSDSPAAYTILDGKRLKVYFAEETAMINAQGKPGTIISSDKFIVACGMNTAVRLTDIQLEGGKRMSTVDFLRGRNLALGTVLE